MAERRICMTIKDMERLGHVLLDAVSENPDLASLQALDNELDRAQAVPPSEIPPDVVTMHSKVRLTDLPTGAERIVTLAFPEEASQSEERISVLSALGTAILGYRAGDEIRRESPNGVLHVRVEEVLYQPEAAGNFDL